MCEKIDAEGQDIDTGGDRSWFDVWDDDVLDVGYLIENLRGRIDNVVNIKPDTLRTICMEHARMRALLNVAKEDATSVVRGKMSEMGKRRDT